MVYYSVYHTIMDRVQLSHMQARILLAPPTMTHRCLPNAKLSREKTTSSNSHKKKTREQTHQTSHVKLHQKKAVHTIINPKKTHSRSHGHTRR
jgi:hypothetical protein